MTAATTPKPAPPKPWQSGFCGKDMPEDSHGRCTGSYDGRPCKCRCHTTVTVDAVVGASLLSESRAMHEAADSFLTADLDGLGWEDAVRVANELKAAAAAIGAAQEFIAKRAGDVWPGQWREEQHVEGVGAAQPYRTKSRVKWDHDGLVKAVMDAHLETTDGEVPDPFTVAGWITEAAQLGYWRIGKLTPLKIEADDYRSSERGNVRLRITGDHMIGDTIERDE